MMRGLVQKEQAKVTDLLPKYPACCAGKLFSLRPGSARGWEFSVHGAVPQHRHDPSREHRAPHRKSKSTFVTTQASSHASIRARPLKPVVTEIGERASHSLSVCE